MTIRYVTPLVLALALLTLNRQPVVGAPADWQTKEGRDQIARLLAGHVDETIDRLQQILVEHPQHQESLFGLVLAYSIKGDITAALQFLRQALEAGLPLERFLAGPRPPLVPLVRSPEFQERLMESGIQLIHGPLVSAVTDRAARIWVRTADEMAVRIEVAETPAFGDSRTFLGATTSSSDFTGIVSVDGLRPDTRYFYRVWLTNEPPAAESSFRTFPRAGEPAAFNIGFGGGAAYTPEFERIWETLAGQDLAAFLMLGDNVYIDHPEMPEVQRYCYYRRQSVPEWRRLTSTVPVFAIWDDHDFVRNDGWGGPDIAEPAWKIPVWNVFRQNWNNPAYGDGIDHPGCWFSFVIADVEFFMLDGRFYRTDPKEPELSMLGPYQKAWLLDRLARSEATFKILASPVPWAFGTKPGSRDTWEGYQKEREEIFSHIELRRIDGVILLSADRHRSDAWRIERPRGYDLYEFESSRLTNLHSHSEMEEALFSYNDKRSFGVVAFDTTQPDPQITYTIINIDGEPVYSLELRKSRISF